MYLSGSIKDLKNILVTAGDVKAEAIHFIAPNIVFILANNKQDYIFMRTGLVIGYSMMMPKTSYSNLLLYVKVPKKGFYTPTSSFYQKEMTSVIVTAGKLLFTGEGEQLMEVSIPSYPLKKEVEFKLEESISPMYEREVAYLKFSPSDAKRILLQKTAYKKKKDRLLPYSPDNALRIEDGQIILYFLANGVTARIETDIRQYAANTKEIDSFFFSDRALYLLRWLCNVAYVDEVVFLPRKEYCVIEGYSGEMTVKIRTSLKNTLVIDEKGL